MVGLPVAGSWTKLGSVLPKALRLAASVLVRVPVPVAVQRSSTSPIWLPVRSLATLNCEALSVGIKLLAFVTKLAPLVLMAT